MKNTIRCCISCILPCGVLDVIRIVHANGRVEEISGTIKAAEVMKAYPKHVLKKPTSPSEEGICPNIVIVPPDAELQRGKIYFLIPVPSAPTEKKKKKKNDQKIAAGRSRSSSRRQNREAVAADHNNQKNGNNNFSVENFGLSDRYLSEILSERLSTQRDRRRGRAGVWRPHLESISETPVEA